MSTDTPLDGGTASERTPWRAAQRAAWEAVNKEDAR
jgi:hypothetical protein